MKKTGIAVVVMLLAVGALAQSEVKSVNAVGYVKVQVPGNALSLCAFNFDPVNGTNGVLMTDVLGDQLTGGFDAGSADNVMFWDRASQQYQTYYKLEGFGWLDAVAFTPMTNRVYNGDGFWIRSNQSGAQEVTFAGEVVDIAAGTNSMFFGQGLNMFGFPYPAEKNVTATTLYTSAKKGFDAGSADNLIVWDAGSQQYATFYALDGFGWFDAVNFVPADFNLQLGVGYWYLRNDASVTTWMEPQPYSLN